MGCNYYFVSRKRKQLKLTEIEKMFYKFELSPIHIGKSSYGWTFSFHQTEYFKSFKEFKEFYEKYKNDIEIENEYGEHEDYYEYINETKKTMEKLNVDVIPLNTLDFIEKIFLVTKED